MDSSTKSTERKNVAFDKNLTKITRDSVKYIELDVPEDGEVLDDFIAIDEGT